jgi:hypothetical protein
MLSSMNHGVSNLGDNELFQILFISSVRLDHVYHNYHDPRSSKSWD